MIKRDITETVYEYDKEGKLVRKVVTETHEEENNTITTYPSLTQWNEPYRNDILKQTLVDNIKYSDSISTSTDRVCTNKSNN